MKTVIAIILSTLIIVEFGSVAIAKNIAVQQSDRHEMLSSI